MEPKKYICHFCGTYYDPKRRHVQRFCCNSCRSKSFIKNKNPNSVVKAEKSDDKENPLKIEKISIAGITNAAIGTLAVNVISNMVKSQGDMPATKNDIKNLTSIIKNRYQPIKNILTRADGAKAFYDLETQTYVYLKKPI